MGPHQVDPYHDNIPIYLSMINRSLSVNSPSFVMASEDFVIPCFEDQLKDKEPTDFLISEQMLHTFTAKIKQVFPTFVASVVADKHGLLMHAEMVQAMDENLLALSAVVTKRKILDLSNYHQLVRSLDKNTKILVLLEKSRDNYLKLGQFEGILKSENPL